MNGDNKLKNEAKKMHEEKRKGKSKLSQYTIPRLIFNKSRKARN